MCCTRISHVYRFHIHLKSDKWNFAIHSSMNCTAFISTTQQISALTSTKYTYSLNIMYDIFCACLLCFFMGIVCTIIYMTNRTGEDIFLTVEITTSQVL